MRDSVPAGIVTFPRGVAGVQLLPAPFTLLTLLLLTRRRALRPSKFDWMRCHLCQRGLKSTALTNAGCKEYCCTIACQPLDIVFGLSVGACRADPNRSWMRSSGLQASGFQRISPIFGDFSVFRKSSPKLLICVSIALRWCRDDAGLNGAANVSIMSTITILLTAINLDTIGAAIHPHKKIRTTAAAMVYFAAYGRQRSALPQGFFFLEVSSMHWQTFSLDVFWSTKLARCRIG